MTLSLLHHVSFGVSDLQAMAAFYDAVLAPLGQVRVWDGPRSVGYGLPGQGDKLLLNLREEGVRPPGAGFHLAFGAPSREAVDRFHAAALAHGGTDNGAPGLREHYGPNYYAAFVIDPEGCRIEAVINAPEQGRAAPPMRIVDPPVSPIEGIALRQIEPGDRAAWFDYLRLPQVFERTSWNLRSAEDLQPVLESYLHESPTSPMRLAVVDQASGRLIGTIGLHTVSDLHRSAEIAYDFAPSHWGRGLATRLCETLASWSFEALGLHRLQATVLVGNERSERVLARCRFRHEGLLRGYRMVRGRPGDFNIFSRLSTDGAGAPEANSFISILP